MNEFYYKLVNILNSNPYYKNTIQFMTNKDLDNFIKQVDPKWVNDKAGTSYALKFKCLKVLQIMTGKTFEIKA